MQVKQHKLFTTEAIDRLSSPERLDQMMQVVSPRSWLPLTAIGCLVAAAGVWSAIGRIPLTVGQRQRLLIVPAMVVKPKIILMDEATSVLDNRTQAIVTDSLDRLKVTRIVIAHRLSTICNADRIYVIEAGSLVEVGSFEELVKQGGLFARLVERQLE